MIKTLHRTLKLEKEKFMIPKSVQQAIPIQRIWPDGIFQSGRLFSKSFRFTDINYSIASKEDKTEMFLDYSELLNALDSGASAKLTINNRRINKAEFEQSILIPMKEDELDEYRKEYNEMLLSKISDTNNSTSMCTQQEIEEKMIKQQKQILQLELEKRKLLEENQRLREVCGILGKEKRENEIRQNSRY